MCTQRFEIRSKYYEFQDSAGNKGDGFKYHVFKIRSNRKMGSHNTQGEAEAHILRLTEKKGKDPRGNPLGTVYNKHTGRVIRYS